MSATGAPRFRQLRLDYWDHAGNPFTAALETDARMSVVLHTRSLQRLDPIDAFIVKDLADWPKELGLDVARTPGPTTVWNAASDGSTLVHIEEVPHDDTAVVRRQVGARTRQHVLRHLHQYPELGTSLAGDAAFGKQLLEVDAVSGFADLIVVGDERLRELRHSSADSANMVSPLEAYVMVGVWCRGTHRPFLTGAVPVGRHWYDWALMRAVLPAAEEPLAGGTVAASQRSVADLQESLLRRTVRIVRRLDRLLFHSQVTPTWEGGEDIAHDLDDLVLAICGLHDNLALLCGTYFAVSGRPRDWSLRSAKFVERLREAGGTDLAAHLSDTTAADWIDLPQEPRNQGVHRELSRVTVGDPRRGISGDTQIVAAHAVFADVRDRLIGLGEDPAQWGLEQIGHFEDLCFITPSLLAARLAAAGLRTANEIVEYLQEAAGRPRGWRREALPFENRPPWRREDRAAALLSSPLSGLLPVDEDALIELTGER